MTTATKAKKTSGVQGLQGERKELLTRRDELLAEVRLIRSMTDPHVHHAPESTRPQRLRAAARRPEVERDLALVQADLEEIEQELRVAQEAERQAKRAAFAERKAPLVRKLAAQLEAAAETNEKLMALEDEEHCATGGVRALLAWPELMPQSESLASRLGVWLDHVRDEGLLPVIEVEEDDDEK